MKKSGVEMSQTATIDKGDGFYSAGSDGDLGLEDQCQAPQTQKSGPNHMPGRLLTFGPDLMKLRNELLDHPVYHAVDSPAKLRGFMEAHVFAVWDFMSIVKRLQRDLTCISHPWTPRRDASLARFINEIVLAEESDLGLDGKPASHFELYISAMAEVGANTAPVLGFLAALGQGASPGQALAAAEVPPYVRAFVLHTLETAAGGSSVEVAANFFYGREDVIPDMFTRLLSHWDATKTPTFQYYLARHIEIDGEDHGPTARRMLAQLAGNDGSAWDAAATAAQAAIQARIDLWNGFLETI